MARSTHHGSTRGRRSRLTAAALALLLSPFGIATADEYSAATAALKNSPPDFATAIPLLVGLTEAGDSRAQYLLGYLAENGLGLPRDEQMALRLYRAAAARGHLAAKASLGRLGEGTFANPEHVRELNDRNERIRSAETLEEVKRRLRRDATTLRGQVLSIDGAGILVSTDRPLWVETDGGTGTAASAIRSVYVWMEDTSGIISDQRVELTVVRSRPYSYAAVSGAARTVPGVTPLDEAAQRYVDERLGGSR